MRALRKRLVSYRFALIYLFLMAALAAGCNDPQAPAPALPGDIMGRYASGKLVFELQTAGGGASPLALVANDLVYDAATHELHAQVALHNGGAVALPGPERVIVHHFVPTNVEPLNAVCTPPDSVFPVAHCSFDHHDTYGSDGLLGAGETSDPVEWVLFVPSGESFAFRAQLGPEAATPGTISGVVFDDRDADGHRDAGEAGIAGATVDLRAGAATDVTHTDALGRYSFAIDAPGIYEISVAPLPGRTPTTPAPLQVTILRRPDGSLSSFVLGDFGFAGPGGGGAPVHVEGFVFEDTNRNGIRDAGETGLPFVEVRGQCGNHGDDDDDAEIRVRTDSEGRYVLALPDCGGPWKVRCESLDGFDRTTPKAITFSHAPSGGESLHADFGWAHEDRASQAEIRGVVFLDLDRDGVRDPLEPGLAGVGVSATGIDCDAPSTATDRTDTRGRYDLEGSEVHCPLPWNLTRAALPGTIATTPATVRIDAPPVDDDYTIDFGVAPDPEAGPAPSYVIEGSVYLDANRSGTREAFEAGIPAVQVRLLGPCDTVRTATTDAAGHYRFEADVVGQCIVTAVWQSLPEFDKHTTPNPAPVDPTGPVGESDLRIDFGVRHDD